MNIEIRDSVISVTAPEHFSTAIAGNFSQRVTDAVISGNADTCIFDFKKTDLIDSSGIGFLVSLAKLCSGKDLQLILKNLNRDIIELFEDTGLDRIFTIDEDRTEKMQSVKEFFENDGVDIKLTIDKLSVGSVGIFIMGGVLSHPLGSSYFKQQILLFLAEHKNILLDLEDLTFFDSLSISSVLNMNNLLKVTGGSLKICAPNFIIRDLLNTLSIDMIIPVFDKRDDALADWSKADER